MSNNFIVQGMQSNVDIVLFSFRRPLQLYATLESIHHFVHNFSQISVLYRSDNDEFDAAYALVQRDFPKVVFIKQGKNPRQDFKPLLLKAVFGGDAEYILFGVDDDIIKDSVDLNTCAHALASTGSYAFYLRLGKNIMHEYKNIEPSSLPYLQYVHNNIYIFTFSEGKGVWAYPNSLDMTIFKKSTVEHFLRNSHYSSPNTLESAWAAAANVHAYGLCFEQSKQFTLPLNIVQQDWYCPHENSYSSEDLLIAWNKGLKMDIMAFKQIETDCSFMGFRPHFVPRHTDLTYMDK